MKFLFALILALAPPLSWALDVVATTSSLGMLAREVGGPALNITELAPPDQDAHTLQAKPSMIRALRDARLLLAVGAELETGWLPAAIASAANPALTPGQVGYFEAAAQVSLLEAGSAADRAHGDVHPAGNPHLQLDPQRMVRVAAALAERLAKLDPPRAADYRQRAGHFAAAVDARLPDWRRRAAGSPGAVLYHKDGLYLLSWLGVPLLGTLEPLPGIPPSASHLEMLASRLKGQRGIVLRTPFQPPAGADKLATLLGWKSATVALDPPAGATAAAYFTLIDRWLDALAAAKP